MLPSRWRKILSDLWDNKVRTALVMVSIAVGVFSVGMIAGAYSIISNDMSQSYAASHPANIEIITDPFDSDLVSSLQHVNGALAVEGRRYINLQVRENGGQWTSLTLIAVSDFKSSQLNLLLPLDGSQVPDKRQVVIERSLLKKLSTAVGSQLEFKLPDGAIKSMPVVGVVLDQSTSAGNFLASPLAYITFDTLERLHQPANFNHLFVTVSQQSSDEAYIQQVSQEVTDRLEKSGRQIYHTRLAKTNEHPMRSTVQAILGVLGALGVLIVFLSSSLIANTLTALLNQHLRHIGVMKLVGGRSSQIFGMYLALIMSFGVIALLIAIPAGGQAAYALSGLIADQMNFNLLGYRVVPMAILIQTAIALLVPLAAGFVPINNGSRISVQRAINGEVSSPVKVKTGWLDRLTARLTVRQTWISRPLLISLRNTFRRKGRLVLTLFTLTMGGAIFIAVFNMRVSLHSYIDDIGKYFLADISLNFDRPYRLQQVEGWAYTSAEVLRPDKSVSLNLQILAPPAASRLVSPMMLSGRWVVPGDENAIAVSESILETFPDLKAGDKLHLKIAGREDDWTVVGIFKFVGSQSLIAYGTFEYISHLLNLPNQAFTFRIVTEQHSKAYQKEISATIDKYFRDQGFQVSDVQAGQSTMEKASEGLDVLITFLLIMALLTAAVGSMGLAGTMSMNVMERTREIGVMRSIGAVDREIIKSVLVEGWIIGLISWFLGLLLSFPITLLLSSIIGIAIFHTPLTFVFTWQGLAAWLGLVLVLSSLASVLPARNAVRLTIREVLAYE
jgi:putative ABC transport system permease protein